MSKRIIFSYAFFFIAVTTQIIDLIFSSSELNREYYYNNLLQFALLVLIVSPITGIVLGLFAKRGKHKLIAIALNAIFFVSISLVALVNLWIITFGK
ncbi:hypothetical protein M3193_15485 [Sporosarcina luteola]|uniref:hypothetical protein n=1 Tax=Sporosarcina luteola TaxID=582850 RepID=UPI00203CEF02|nr:hypothetical protein [Sporosarcina luteola]MCM3745529.1 hypothetical protein [Sporosarcina luteola]